MKNKITSKIPLIILIISICLIISIRGIPLFTVIISSFIPNMTSKQDVALFNNYYNVLNDEIFWTSLSNSFLILLHIPFLILLSFSVSLIIHDGMKYSNLYKTIIVFPQIVSTVTIASIFGCIFGYYGPINSAIQLLELPPLYWLGEKTSAIFVIILCLIYSSFGWQTLIFSSALSTVDPNIQALVKLDGVKFWRRFQIYIHQIKDTIFYSLILNIIYGFTGNFSVIFTLTHGGPGYSTTTIDYLIYLRAFKYGSDMTAAYTISTLLLVLVLFLVTILYFVVKKRDINEKA